MSKTTKPPTLMANPRPSNFRDTVAVMISENYQLPPDVYDSTYTYKERDTNVNRYWGTTQRKYFPIDMADLANLYDKSDEYFDARGNNHGQSIIVYVQNMDDPKTAKLSWLPYKNDTIWDNSLTSYYWILPRKFFDGNVSNDPDFYLGGIAICEKAHIICGMIGENANDMYYVYVNSVEMAYDKGMNNYGAAMAYQEGGSILLKADGSTIGGVKIPSN